MPCSIYLCRELRVGGVAAHSQSPPHSARPNSALDPNPLMSPPPMAHGHGHGPAASAFFAVFLPPRELVAPPRSLIASLRPHPLVARHLPTHSSRLSFTPSESSRLYTSPPPYARSPLPCRSHPRNSPSCGISLEQHKTKTHASSNMTSVRNMPAFVCVVSLLAIASQVGFAHATARLQIEPTDLLLEAPSDTEALQQILQAASSSLQATYTSINPKDPLFPDVADQETGLWHVDEVNANGAAGLLAGCLWSMHKLTGQDMWRARALTASAALRSSVDDLSLGQAMGTLVYPAIRYAYEAETDAVEKELYLHAALRAADTLSKMFAYIPGVFKVRPTSHIADEAREAGAAIISPLAVFSSVEGAAAATGLLTWAAQLPGGKAAWLDMALMNARKIVTDHMDNAGSVVGTLVYKATSAREEPRLLSSWTSAEPRPASSLVSLIGGSPEASAGGAAAALDPAASVLEAWLSQVAGQESSPELRQALATLALVEAARAAGKASDIALFASAVQATAASLVSQAAHPLAMEPVAAAATACALAELSTLQSLPVEERDEYALTARRVILALAQQSAGQRPGASSLAQLAGRWMSSLLQLQQQRQAPASAAAAQHHAVPGITQAKLLLLRGVARGNPIMAPHSFLQLGSAGAAPQSPAILSHPDGSGGSMLADHLFLQALRSLTEAY